MADLQSGNNAQFSPGKSTISPAVDTKFDTSDLARIVAAWPHLPAAVRRAMLALLEI